MSQGTSQAMSPGMSPANATGLFETLHGLVTSGVTRAASAAFDEHASGTGRALDAAFGAVLLGLERNIADSGVMSEVARLVGDRGNDPAILHDVAGLVERSATAPAQPHAARLIDLLFGDRAGIIAGAVARASGLGHQAGAALLGAAGSMALAMLAKRLGSGVPPANLVSGVIVAERNTLAGAVPPYLRRLIIPVRDGGTKLAPAPAPGPAAFGYRSLVWLLVPLLLLGGFVWFLMWALGTSSDDRLASSPPARTEAEGPRDRTGSTSERARWFSDADESAAKREGDGATRQEARQPQPGSVTLEWSTDAPPRPRDPSASSTWTAPAATTTNPARRDPPLAGLERITLADGTEIDIVPVTGVERKMVDFVTDRWSAIDKTLWFDFDRIRFRSGSSDLTPGSRVQLRNTAAIMKAYPRTFIKIGGYTDNVGDPSANLRLSTERAQRVMAELVKLGVDPARLDAEGYGDQHPIADNATAEGRAKNRRTALSVRAK